MDEKTEYLLSRYKIQIQPTEAHSPRLSLHRGRTGETVNCDCSCGQWDMRFIGCNEAGVCYAVHDAIKGWRKHVELS